MRSFMLFYLSFSMVRRADQSSETAPPCVSMRASFPTAPAPAEISQRPAHSGNRQGSRSNNIDLQPVTKTKTPPPTTQASSLIPGSSGRQAGDRIMTQHNTAISKLVGSPTVAQSIRVPTDAAPSSPFATRELLFQLSRPPFDELHQFRGARPKGRGLRPGDAAKTPPSAQTAIAANPARSICGRSSP